MPPRSPTLAFDPTPALEQSHFSTLNGIYRYRSMDHYNDEHSKEVRFKEPALNGSMRGRHSIATSTVPLLQAVSSASHIPKQSFRITNPLPDVDITAYFEQCRNVNEQLRKAHEQDRKAWDIERSSLRTRIADLEFRLNKASAGRRRLSNESGPAIPRQFKPDLHSHFPNTNSYSRHIHSISNAPIEHLKTENGRPIWEPDSPAPATRVFSQDEDVRHLPSISEDDPCLSPHSYHENKPIPIQELDHTLDGITVKSEGVRSSFNRIMSPIIIPSPARSPSPKQQSQDIPRISLDHSSFLDPLDAKRKRHAGHTPLAFDGSLSTSAQTTGGGPTPHVETPLAREEKTIAPAPTTRPPLRPSEVAQSYFSTDDIHAPAPEEVLETDDEKEPDPQWETVEDKPLSGPLMLDSSGKSESSHNFLEKLDDMLEEVVRKSLSSSPVRAPNDPDLTAETRKPDDDHDHFPMLRMKKSTNFGSAYGFSMPGVCQRS